MDTTHTQLGTIALFCKAAELGGFTAAAQALGLTPAAVSRGVGRLEESLGLKLFRRTTRSMQLTDDGRVYFEQCRAALAQIEEAQASLTGAQTQVRGVLRISAPSTYAHYRLLPRVHALRRLHPQLEIEIDVSSRNIDFVEEGYDVAIRLGPPPDSRLVAIKVDDAPLGVYASPAYLQEHGVPQTLSDLQDPIQHKLLPFVRPSTGRVLPWLFIQDGQAFEFAPRSTVRVSGEPLGCVTLARAGVGVIQIFHWIAQAHAQELTEILTPYSGCAREFYLLYPQNRNLSAKVRAFVQFLVPNRPVAGVLTA